MIGLSGREQGHVLGQLDLAVIEVETTMRHAPMDPWAREALEAVARRLRALGTEIETGRFVYAPASTAQEAANAS